jgi:cell division protein FtsQ
MVGAGGYAVSRSALFAARSIVVKGNVHLSRAQVLRLGGVSPETNLVWLSPASVEGDLGSSPWVVSATVERAFPSSLTILVVERVAVAVAGSPKRYLIAADRTVLGPVAGEASLPLVETGVDRLRTGERVPEPAAAFAAVAALPPTLRPGVARAKVNEQGVLTMTLRDGASVIYGDATQAEEKGLALQALLRWADRHDVVPATLDVRAPARPALRPEGAPTAPTIVTSP